VFDKISTCSIIAKEVSLRKHTEEAKNVFDRMLPPKFEDLPGKVVPYVKEDSLMLRKPKKQLDSITDKFNDMLRSN
jgi:hypothetical protein